MATGLPAAAQQASPVQPLKLTSPAFDDLSRTVPQKYTCAASKPVSPPLEWSGVPKEAVSLALIVHDLDGQPRRGVESSLHWMIWNIPIEKGELPEGISPRPELADGTRQSTPRPDTPDNVGFRCFGAQPGNPHHYVFELFALDQKLDVTTGAKRADVLRAMDGHIVGKAVLVGLFHR
jgi:Raf kinase inhibitor-like YbhB/YbcL family protein